MTREDSSMMLSETFADEFIEQLSSCKGQETSTSNTKFKQFETWFEAQTGRSVAVTYLSSVGKEYRARVGAAVMGQPDVIVLLSSETWAGSAYIAKLEDLVRYIGRLGALVGCVGHGHEWRVDVVVGGEDSSVQQALARAFPRAESHRVPA